MKKPSAWSSITSPQTWRVCFEVQLNWELGVCWSMFEKTSGERFGNRWWSENNSTSSLFFSGVDILGVGPIVMQLYETFSHGLPFDAFSLSSLLSSNFFQIPDSQTSFLRLHLSYFIQNHLHQSTSTRLNVIHTKYLAFDIRSSAFLKASLLTPQ